MKASKEPRIRLRILMQQIESYQKEIVKWNSEYDRGLLSPGQFLRRIRRLATNIDGLEAKFEQISQAASAKELSQAHNA
jgi:hypothetical protein